MNDTAHLRAKALEQMDAARRWFLFSFYGALLFEGLFLLGAFWFANLKDPLHLLILCCTGLIYMPVILGLVALGAHVNRVVLRVLARLDS